MRAVVTRPFLGVEDGKVYPRRFAPGETVTGELAALAVAGGDARPAEAGAAGPQLPRPEPAAVAEPKGGNRTPEEVGEAPAIPADWESLAWPALRRLAAALAGAPVTTREEARQAVLAAPARTAGAGQA